jgi:tetratricopeptide (TPR) repeat protein
MLYRLILMSAAAFVVAGCSLFSGRLLADVSLTFGSDANENKEVSELVTKNAKATSAIAAFKRGDLRLCEELLNEAYKDSKDLPKVDVMMSRLLIQKGQYMDALIRLENYIRNHDQDVEAHASLGEIALRTGRLSDAWLQFREAMTLLGNSGLSKARREDFMMRLTQLRAETAEARNDLETAEKLYQELVKLLPKAGYPVWAQGRIQVVKEKLDEGMVLLKRAKELDKNLPQPELEMAKALAASAKEDRDKLAEEWFKKALLQTETSTIMNWFDFANWLLVHDRPEDARSLLKKAPEEFRQNPMMKFLDAFALRYLGKNQEAEMALSELHDANPGMPEVTDQLALLLIESPDQGKKVRAQQLALTNVRRSPNDENAIATYGWIELKLGTTDVANRIFGELGARGTANPQTLYYIGRWLEQAGMEIEALVAFEAAVKNNGHFVQRATMRENVKERRAKLVAAGKIKEEPAANAKEQAAAASTKEGQGKADPAGAKSATGKESPAVDKNQPADAAKGAAPPVKADSAGPSTAPTTTTPPAKAASGGAKKADAK